MAGFCLQLYNFIVHCGLTATNPYDNLIMIDYRLFQKEIPNQAKQAACDNISYYVRIENNKVDFFLMANLSYICDSECTKEKLAYVLSQFPFDYPQFTKGIRMNIGEAAIALTYRMNKPLFSPIQRTYSQLEEFFVDCHHALSLILLKTNKKIQIDFYFNFNS